VHREVEEGDEGGPGPRQILPDVRRKVEVAEVLVEHADRTGVEVERLLDHPAHLVEVPVHLLEHGLESA